MREYNLFNGLANVMQAVAIRDVEINEVGSQRGKLSGAKVPRETGFGQMSLDSCL
jgi:hypothetical protein